MAGTHQERGTELPGYLMPGASREWSSSHAPAAFFEIAVHSDASSFQKGYLGLEDQQASIVGEILIKSQNSAWLSNAILTCTVEFRAVESVYGANPQEMELFHAKQTLWQNSSWQPTNEPIPSRMAFAFPLTHDLPQCIHGHDSSLLYTIEASLLYKQGQVRKARTLVHPVRYTSSSDRDLMMHSSPGFEIRSSNRWNTLTPNSRYSLSPLYWMTSDPVPVHYWLDRSVVRNTEPIQIQVHIPPPDQHLVLHQGLQLLSVETELIRVTQSHANGIKLSDEVTLQRAVDSQLAKKNSCTSSTGASQSIPFEPNMRFALVAYSGKSCRFHSQNPVHLSFALRSISATLPQAEPFNTASTQHNLGGDGRCESITQDTPLHSVRFVFCVRTLLRDRDGNQRDVCTGQLVKLIPAAADTDLSRSSYDSPSEQASDVPTTQPSNKKNGKAPAHQELDAAAWFMNPVEYDGYDDASMGGSTSVITAVAPNEQHSESLTSSIQQPRSSQLNFAVTHTQDPPPSITEHYHDCRLADDLSNNASYATQLASLPHADDHRPGMDQIISPDTDQAVVTDELPNFDQASQQPDFNIMGFHVPIDVPANPSAWPLPLSGLPQAQQTQPALETQPSAELPSYTDLAPAIRSSALSNDREPRPPAYFSDTARCSLPSESANAGLTTNDSDQSAIFPPLYEA
ncbi:hypothetical protein MPSI1_002739 [Malassezia psittaci]|uniref:Uncharacterized protein n=1 Tax=Malassezia psittaci TaxID=1821823 RepID=A0AAF0FCR2_9BASI|nr:hypothetical protein MPSI1_002739 [Malassezia psittaci]